MPSKHELIKAIPPLGIAAVLGAGLLIPVHAGSLQELNPKLSVILDGIYYDDSTDGEGYEKLGEAEGIFHVHGHDDEEHHHAHGLEQGFNLRETEIVFSASVDQYFDALVNLTVSDEGGTELEEAYFTTTGLPAGLRIKGGKFLSGIGYHNEKHPHYWDFVDQNLAYSTLLGDHGLSDKGLQLTWLPAWDHYTLFGIEALQGDNNEKLGTLADHGEHLPDAGDAPRLWTAFFKYAPDLGHDHALQLGLFTARFGEHQEVHMEGEPSEHALAGDAALNGVDLVYKYDSGRAYGQGDWRLQAEYLRANKDLSVVHHAARPAVEGQFRKFTEDGFYVQGTYGIVPRWELGLRYGVVGLENDKDVPSPGTDAEYDSSDRWTAAATWHLTEMSRLRLQLARAHVAGEDGDETFNQYLLQYQHSLGSHGAHAF